MTRTYRPAATGTKDPYSPRELAGTYGGFRIVRLTDGRYFGFFGHNVMLGYGPRARPEDICALIDEHEPPSGGRHA